MHLHAKSAVDLADWRNRSLPRSRRRERPPGEPMSINNLKQIGLAFHNYAQANSHFPPLPCSAANRREFPYSWRVAILPYLEQEPSIASIISTSPGTAPTTAS